MNKRSLRKKTTEVALSTFLSRMLGIIREILKINYLGAGGVADAFFTSFKIPNSLRRIFAEGALSAVFVPTLVTALKKDNKQEVSRLITLGFLVFEGFLLALCLFVFFKTELVLRFIVPGWFTGGVTHYIFGYALPLPPEWFGTVVANERVALAVPYLRILIGFIVCISSSALLAGALHTVNHFFITAFAPVLFNLVFISGLLICHFFHLDPWYLCWFVMAGGGLYFLVHLVVYLRYGFRFSCITLKTLRYFKTIMWKFFPCLLSMSIMEIGLFIDTSFASYLPEGSISLLFYANRFMQIPLGVFAAALATTLFPYFTRISLYAPKRFSFFLFETTKLVAWITVPSALIMGFFSEQIFMTIFYGKKFSLLQVMEVKNILIAFLLGLFFFSLNKILLNMYYALHNTFIPATISLASTVVNIGFNLLFLERLQATGLALATSLSLGIVQTVLLLLFLSIKFKFKFYVVRLVQFFVVYLLQLGITMSLFYGIYRVAGHYVAQLPEKLAYFFMHSIGFWFWVGPLCLGLFAVLFFTRKLFRIKLYFLD